MSYETVIPQLVKVPHWRLRRFVPQEETLLLSASYPCSGILCRRRSSLFVKIQQPVNQQPYSAQEPAKTFRTNAKRTTQSVLTSPNRVRSLEGKTRNFTAQKASFSPTTQQDVSTVMTASVLLSWTCFPV